MSEWNWEHITKQDSLTEGPAWDGTALLFSHCAANRTLRYDPVSGEVTVWKTDTNGANGMLFDRHGRLYVCEGAGRRIARYEDGALAEVIVDNFDGKAFNEPNDLAIDDDGNIYFSDPNYGGRPMELDNESVYRAAPRDGSWDVARVTFDTARPNGVLLDIRQTTLYVAESPHDPTRRRQLRAYPINPDGTLGDHEVLHDFGPYRGVDGMCLTDEGNIVACAGSLASGPGPMIYVFAPNGRVLSTHPTPADRPTNCTFAGENLDVLYVTFGTGDVYRAPDTGMRGHLLYPAP